VVTPYLIELSRGADLALQDALSVPIIQALARAAAGTRPGRILHDIQDYHASTATLAALKARQLAVYHLVPAPQNYLLEQIFQRDLPPDTLITEDRMVFELPAGSTQIDWYR